jgi:hypothetical protein
LTSLLISSSRSLFQVGSVAGNRNAAERGGRRWPASQYERWPEMMAPTCNV